MNLSVSLAAAAALIGWGSGNPPDACKLLTLTDVTAVLGTGYAVGPAEARVNTSEMSGCLYQRGVGNLVAIAILGAPNGNARTAVLARQESQQRFGRAVTPLPALCDAAFIVVISPANTTLIAAKGAWQIEFQITTGGKPNADAEQRLAKTVCARA